MSNKENREMAKSWAAELWKMIEENSEPKKVEAEDWENTIWTLIEEGKEEEAIDLIMEDSYHYGTPENTLEYFGFEA